MSNTYLVGDYIRNKETKRRGDIICFYNNDTVRVIVHPSDIIYGRWETWRIEDIEYMYIRDE
jgi:hypothetical protein